ncbi:hypothetical protein BaRGS_00017255 [Batillaria attramentaria]|uniref:BTB domain-containing protein n=1 Tax=Batillaria attramentaria TaxID=370345 RepID=A0ABD0KVT8_9CAEN
MESKTESNAGPLAEPAAVEKPPPVRAVSKPPPPLEIAVSQYQGTKPSTASSSPSVSATTTVDVLPRTSTITSTSSLPHPVVCSPTFIPTSTTITDASNQGPIVSSSVKKSKGPVARAQSESAQGDGKGGKKLSSAASDRGSSVSATFLTSASDESSLSAADGQGDSPHKLLQAVRSTNLPYPLPVPSYSQAVQAARASGNVLSERATIIRETVKFFLFHKYWWTSDDYDRIAELVVNEFPELRDPFTWPSQPCYSKVRLDLSMCARNIRRIAKNQEKKRGSPRRHSTESAEMPAESPSSAPAAGASKPTKSSGKAGHSGRRASAQLSRSPTMVPQSISQMLPHTAHTAHNALVTSTPLLDQKQVASVPYLLTSTASTTPTPAPTVLPPVAHFLGHAPPHSQGPGGIVFPSLVPATAAVNDTSTVASAATGLALPQVSSAIASQLNTFSAVPATEWQAKQTAGLENAVNSVATISSACCPETQLPDPLPVPPYSDKVMKAKKMGITKYERPLIIRETVLFFLSLKYWWSSFDYDRISDFVVEYFPDLRDPVLSPNIPPNRRVRTDLSQTARNIRRREVMLKRRDSRSPEERFAAVGTVTSLVSPSVQQPATDFCNELLAAASIIESRTAAMQHTDTVAQKSDSITENCPETNVIAHTDTSKAVHADVPGKVHANSTKKDKSGLNTSRNAPVSISDVSKLIYSSVTTGEPREENVEHNGGPTVLVKPSSEMAVVKHEVEEDDAEQQQALHAQWQTLSAQMSQALSMQALSAQMTQALTAAQISEHLMSSHVSPRPSLGQTSVSPGTQQMTPTTSSAAVTTLSLQQLSQAQAYGLATTSGAGDDAGNDPSHVDRMSAMAMWRSTCLPDPLPTPPFSLNVLRARDAGNTASARPRIIRETTQFFLAMKMWWTTQDYERIAELVLRHFPALRSVQNIKKDLGTCARNMRRRLPLSRYKPAAYSKQWASYQSPPHSLLKDTVGVDGDGQARGAGLTLGELATMASLREAVGQDKGIAEAGGMGALTEEQRQTLLAHSMYEQSTLAWNALYQQQFSTPTQETPVIPQARGTKRSLSDTTAIKVAESLEREILAGAFKRHTSVEQAPKVYPEVEAAHHHSVDVSSGELQVQAEDLKMEPLGTTEGGKKAADATKLSDIYAGIRDLPATHTPAATERKVSDSAAYLTAAPSVTMSESLVHAHQKPARAHSQSSLQVRHDPGSLEDAPINLTCSTVTAKHEHSGEKEATKSEPHSASPKRSRSSSLETFSAREQVWFPHGSPWKKSGQTLFKALPNPLPAPKYSQKLLKAREEGLAYRHRSEVIRETARFFLSFKYWWSSADYSRISELVVSQFPDLKDPVTHPGQPSYRRVQRDLSMCARNLRRKNTRRQKLSLADVARSPKKSKGATGKEKKAAKASKLSEKHEAASPDSQPGPAAPTEIFHQAGSMAKVLPQTVTVSSTSTPSLAHTIVSSAAQHTMSSDTGGKAVADLLPESRSGSAVAALLAADSHSRPPRNGSEWSIHPSSVHKSVTGTHPSLASAVGYAQNSSAASVGSHLPATSNTTLSAASAYSTPKGETYLSKAAESGPTTSQRSLKASRGETPRGRSASAKHGPKTSRHKPSAHESTDIKSVTPVSHTRHVQPPLVEEGTREPAVQTRQSEAGSHDETGQHGHWASGPGTYSQVSSRQAVSNTTAIVTPTLSEAPAHSTEPRVTEGSISHKVYIDPDHGSELQAQLTKLWQDGKFFDASLEVDGYRLPVHKLVLLAASPYLQSTFRHANPTSHLEVNLPRETAVGAARDFLKYVYQGVLHVGPDTVHALRRIAAMLQIEKLLTYCDDYLRLLNTGFSTSFSLPDTLTHGTSQVPRVSVNLRDAAHSHHAYTTDDGITLTRLPQTSETAYMPHTVTAADHAQGVVSGSGRHTTSRKRRASSTVTHRTVGKVDQDRPDTDQEGCEQQTDHCEGQQGDYQPHGLPAGAAYIATHTASQLASDSQVLLTQPNTVTNRQGEDMMDTSQGSLLPQTYCSSPQSTSPADK